MITWQEYEEPYGPHTPWLDNACLGEQYSCLCHAVEAAMYDGYKPNLNRPLHMSVDEGAVSVNCDWCGCSPHGVEHEELYMYDVPVELVFVPDHPNLGGWHGDTRCDCGWWWEIKLKD